MSKKARSALLALLVVLSVLSLATMGCDGTDGFLDDVIEGEKQNWREISGSVTDPTPKKTTGFIGAPGKFLCESTGGRYVASIDACYRQ